MVKYIFMNGGMKIKSKAVLPVLLLLQFIVSHVAAAPLTFNGTVSYKHDEEDENTTRVAQSTNLSFDHELNPAMRLDETIRYTTSWEEGEETESIAPTLDYEILNDIFQLELSGTANKQRNSDQNNRSSRSWESRWRSTWEKELWPVVQLNYGQNFSEDDQDPRGIDIKSTISGFDIDWDLLLANVYYSIDQTDSDDYVADSNNLSTNEIARFSTEKGFWDDRFRITFLEQYTKTSQEFTSKVGTTGFALVPVIISEIRGKNDYDQDEPDEPEWDELTSGLPTAIHDQKYNLALRVDSQQVNEIYIYTAEDLTDDANLFQWDLYTSSNGVDWMLQQTAVPLSYDLQSQRFELRINEVNSRYIMLVEEEIPTNDDFSINSVEAFSYLAGAVGEEVTTETETTNYLTDASVNWRLTTDLLLIYTFALEDGTTAVDEDIDRTSHTASFRWNPTDLFSSTVTASETQEQQGAEDETTTRSYAASMSSQILPTLDVNLGVTRNENYEAGEKSSTSHNYNLFSTATFFPDLSSSLDLVYTTTRDEETDELTQNFNSSLKLTARLNPKLTVDFSEIYTSASGDESTWSTISRVNVSWRPSDILSMNAAGSKEWESDDSSPVLYNLNMALAPTKKTQTTLGYNHAETSDDYNMSWNWTINRIFSMRLTCNYQDSDDDNSFIYEGLLTVRY